MAMSNFTTALVLSRLPGTKHYHTTCELVYDIGFKGSGLTVTVPNGFVTDLATIPRLFRPILPPDNPKYAPAAVIHDYLYSLDGFTRVVADAVFYEGMRALGVGRYKAALMYITVRLANRWR